MLFNTYYKLVTDCADENNFRCWDGSCISKVNKCDGKVNCPNDNSDEVECGKLYLC